MTSVRVFLKVQLQMMKDELAIKNQERHGLVRSDDRDPFDGDGETVTAHEDAGMLRRRITLREVVVSVLYGINLTFSYLLMLAVMSYNVGLFVIIVIGLATGHYAFNASLPSSLDSAAGGAKSYRHTSGGSESSDVCHSQM